MMDDFVSRALLGGLGVAIVLGPLGCFLIWRRMAFFSDTLSHSALLGVALGFLLGIDLFLGTITACVVVAILLVTLERQKQIPSDALLAILAHSALSIGLICLAFIPDVRVDIMTYLLGDILTISNSQVLWIYVCVVMVLSLLFMIWHHLLSFTINEDMAAVEGTPIFATRLALMLLMALVIGLAMKVVGVLLISGLMLIPAATASRFSRTPEEMAYISSLVGCCAVLGGVLASLQWDIPTGPAIVVSAAVLFLTGNALPRAR